MERPPFERPPRSDLARHWALDPGVVFLNHGSFGACPTAVQEAQASLRAGLEADPVRFLARELDDLLDGARAEIGVFVDADPGNLALVPNATAGVNTVLRSHRFAPGDELLATDHEYNAALNGLRFAAERDGARVVLARIPLPVAGGSSARTSGQGCPIRARTPRRSRTIVPVPTLPIGRWPGLDRRVTIPT